MVQDRGDGEGLSTMSTSGPSPVPDGTFQVTDPEEIADTLHEHQLLEGHPARKPHPTDRRATLVTLTEQGQAVDAAWQTEHHQGAGQLFGDVPAADLTTFVTTLDLVLDRLRQTYANP